MTKKATPESLEQLWLVLQSVSEDLRGVTKRKMFGCQAVFANGNIFALIWKTGRIGVKITDPGLFRELMAKSGSDPWQAGDRTMSNWILVPESFHRKEEMLSEWVTIAHELAARGTPPSKRPGKAAPRGRRSS
jgi:TfoX/Sxy family transcriptional regulator of competence genes